MYSARSMITLNSSPFLYFHYLQSCIFKLFQDSKCRAYDSIFKVLWDHLTVKGKDGSFSLEPISMAPLKGEGFCVSWWGSRGEYIIQFLGDINLKMMMIMKNWGSDASIFPSPWMLMTHHIERSFFWLPRCTNPTT